MVTGFGDGFAPSPRGCRVTGHEEPLERPNAASVKSGICVNCNPCLTRNPQSGLRPGGRIHGVSQKFVRVRHPLLGLGQRYRSAPQLGYADVPGAKRRVKLGLRQLQFGSRFLDQEIGHCGQRQAGDESRQSPGWVLLEGSAAAVSLRRRMAPGARERKLRSRTQFFAPLLTRRGCLADETERRDRPEPAEGRHHCRWIGAANRSVSTIWTSREAGGPKETSACAALRARLQARRANRALAGSHPPPRRRRCRDGATRERSRPRGRPKSMTPRWPSFPQGSVPDRS